MPKVAPTTHLREIAFNGVVPTPYSVVRWEADDLTASAEEIAISEKDFELLKQKHAPDTNTKWLEETPEECVYRIIMDVPTPNCIETLQEVELTREEYITLKHHLAVMRGHVPNEEK